MADLIPYGYTFETERLPTSLGRPLPDGQYHVVHFTLHSGMDEMIVEKLDKWFEDRNDISLVDQGETAAGNSFVVLEWAGIEIDPLFLKILEHDESVIDYSTYYREEDI